MNMDKDQTESRIEKTGRILLEMFEAKSDSDQVQSTQEMTKSVRKRSTQSVGGNFASLSLKGIMGVLMGINMTSSSSLISYVYISTTLFYTTPKPGCELSPT